MHFIYRKSQQYFQLTVQVLFLENSPYWGKTQKEIAERSEREYFVS